MNFTDVRFDGEGVRFPGRFVGQGFPSLRLLDDSEVPASGDLLLAPSCVGCCEGMEPVGASGWWCDPCQEYQ